VERFHARRIAQEQVQPGDPLSLLDLLNERVVRAARKCDARYRALPLFFCKCAF